MERYDGYFFRIIKKANDDDVLRKDLDVVILSAEFGIVDSDDQIPDYDRRMSPKRATELRDDVVSTLRDRVRHGEHERVVINMAKDYERAIEDFANDLDVTVHRIRGGGIGEKGHKLKQLIRVDGHDGVGGE